MKLIIDITEGQYKAVQDGVWCGSLYEELKNGIPVEPCGDCISRESVSGCVSTMYYKGLGKQKSLEYILKYVERLPSVSPQQKVGQWIFHKPFDNEHKNCNECIECSQCHTWLGYDCYAKTQYCPFCGCKMQEVE